MPVTEKVKNRQPVRGAGPMFDNAYSLKPVQDLEASPVLKRKVTISRFSKDKFKQRSSLSTM
jgi:hypothetical protein